MRKAGTILTLFALISTSPAKASAPPPPHVVTIATIRDLRAPAAAIYDAKRDVYLVSNINGEGTARDGNGSIAIVSPDDLIVSTFIEGGRNGVTLDAPKGLALDGTVLWVADIDRVRAFDRTTGAPLRDVDLAPLGALFLNGVASDGAGGVYVTDTRLQFEGANATHKGPDRIYRVTAEGKASVAFEGKLGSPSAIRFDPAHHRYLVCSLGGKSIYSWTPGKSPAVAFSGTGGYDGVALDGDRWIVTSLDTAALLQIGGGKERTLVERLGTPATLDLDPRRHRAIVPSFDTNSLAIVAFDAIEVGAALLRIEPYTNAWRLTYSKPGRDPIDAAVWTDAVTADPGAPTILRRKQVATYNKAKTPDGKPMVITTENVFDATTMAAISRRYERADGVHHYVDFDGSRATFETMNERGKEPSKGTIDTGRPMFDFYGGMWGLLLAAMPLREGMIVTLPSLDESKDELRWATCRVVRREPVDAGSRGKVDAWVVETNDHGAMTFWLTQSPPYVIKLVYETPQGVTATYTMM